MVHRVVLLLYAVALLTASPSTAATNAASSAVRRALLYGFDYGTSGVRCCLIDSSTAAIVHEDALRWSDVLPAAPTATVTERWGAAMQRLLANTPEGLRPRVERICVSGTSSTVLLYDAEARAVSRQPRMYDFNVVQQCADPAWGPRALAAIRKGCPIGSAANAATSTLAKVLAWHYEAPVRASERLVHQADYVVHYLSAAGDGDGTSTRAFTSDWHNALKLGYDVHRLEYPSWLLALLQDELGVSPQAVAALLPVVSEPGRPVATVGAWVRDTLGFSHPDCQVVAGTTDSIAAFLASGADHPGQAVTSLGSTVAVKLLSERPVEDSARGVYAHRLGDRWLVGGASNVGCAVLRQEKFSEQELVALSKEIDPSVDSPLRYYPLLAGKVGERFPVSDPLKEPLMDPKPVGADGAVCRRRYLHGLLQGVAEVERAGYQALADLGATPVTEVLTAGGGASNDVWTRMRQRMLGVPTARAGNADAAYGCARLAGKYHTFAEIDER